MDEQFLIGFQKEPDPEFLDRLYERISRQETAVGLFRRRLDPWSPVSLTVMVAFIAGCSYLAASPTAQAEVIERIRTIAGISYEESSDDPYDDPSRTGPLTSTYLGLEEARSTLPFEFGLPSWLPDGFQMQGDVMVITGEGQEGQSSASNVYVTWVRVSQGVEARIILIAQPSWIGDCPECAVPVGPASIEETSVRGAPAAIIRGYWDVESQSWKTEPRNIALRWSDGDIHYYLHSIEDYVSAEDLMKVAESIP